MRTQSQLLHSRTRVKPRYALLPLEGIPYSRLPEWPQAQVRVLAGPALGAGFAEYMLDLAPGQTGAHPADGQIEFFMYVLSGSLTIAQTSLLLLRKRYEPAPGVPMYSAVVGNEKNAKGQVYYDDPGALLQVLIPDETAFDIAMNIFTFEVGHSLPITETHVMEHGLYVLQGKGTYFLDDAWMEVEATDFIWMGPFCPQSYYATGPVASRYIYYKNVNREIPL